jgi:outer membrane receptor protein involved in Fe transport
MKLACAPNFGNRFTWMPNYYRNSYKDFLGYIIGIKSDFIGKPLFLIPVHTEVFRYTTNSTSKVNTQGFGISLVYEVDAHLSLNGNYSFNELTKTNKNDPCHSRLQYP